MKNQKLFKRIIATLSIVAVLAASAVIGVYALSDITSTNTVTQEASCSKDFLKDKTTGIIKADGQIYLYNPTTESASEKPMDKKDLQVLYIEEDFTGTVRAEDYNNAFVIYSKVQCHSGSVEFIKENTGKTVSAVLLAEGKAIECTNNEGKITLGSKELDIKDVTDLYVSTDVTFNADNMAHNCPNMCTITTDSEIPATA